MKMRADLWLVSSVRNCSLSRLFLFIIIIAATGSSILYFKQEDKPLSINQVGDPMRDNPDFLRRIAAQLIDIGTEVGNSNGMVSANVYRRLNKIVNQLYPPAALSEEELNSPINSPKNKTSEVCDEKFMGNRYGKPFFQVGFVMENCTHKKPLNELVTVLVNLVEWTQGHFQRAGTILQGIRTYHSTMPVVFGVDERNISVEDSHLRVLKFDKNMNHGAIWNNLAREVKTPYLLIAKDITHFTSYARLERQIQVLSSIEHLGVVAGAFRNLTGHWKAGCYQSEIRNFHLKYSEGYYFSTEECMFCDYMTGSFMARSSLLRQYPFNEILPKAVVFQDWFLNLKSSNILSVLCPDVMYFTAGIPQKEMYSRDSWMKLASKLQVNKVSIPPNTKLRFTCKEVKFSCDPVRWESKLLPPCCLAEIVSILHELDSVAQQFNVLYEVEDEVVLGAVKFGSLIPWNAIPKIYILANNSDTIISKLKRKLPLITSVKPDKQNNSIWFVTKNNIQLKVYIKGELPSKSFSGNVSTHVELLGTWLMAPVNPGLYARLKYGSKYLKHTYPHMKTDFEHYCSHPRHACFNSYRDTGNIQFSFDEMS